MVVTVLAGEGDAENVGENWNKQSASGSEGRIRGVADTSGANLIAEVDLRARISPAIL